MRVRLAFVVDDTEEGREVTDGFYGEDDGAAILVFQFCCFNQSFNL